MPWVVSLLLSIIAGYVDTAGFLQFSGLFAAHVTGNFVLFAVAVGAGISRADYLKLVAFPVFVVAIFVTTWLYDLAATTSAEQRSQWLLWTVSAILLFVGIAGWLSPPDQVVVQYALALAIVAAMGVQNALHRLNAKYGPATTVMTSNVAQLSVSALRSLSGWTDPAGKTARAGFRNLLLLVCGFAAGCVLAVPATHALGLVGILIPGVALALVLLLKGRVPGL